VWADIPAKGVGFFSRAQLSCFETLYLLNPQDHIIGISGSRLTKNPSEIIRQLARKLRLSSQGLWST
jgi:hypothetical protein